MSVALSPARLDAVAALRAVLDEVGYAQLYAALAGGGLFPADRRRALTQAAALGGEPGATLRLLALGEALEEEALPPRLAALAAAFVDAGLAGRDDGRVRLEDLVVVHVLGGALLTATPPTWGPPRALLGRAYLGEDSLRLARALPDLTGRTVLDLGAGAGVQGLLAARGAERVVLSDLEPRSVELAALNAHLNDRQAATEVVAGDAYAPVVGRRFDAIVTLAPYLPSVPGTRDGVVAAGADGLDLLRRIVAGAGAHLRPGGELVALAQLLCDDEGPLLARELPSLAGGLDARLVCFDAHRLQPFALELATRRAPDAGEPVKALLGRFLETFRSRGATGVCFAFLRLRASREHGARRAPVAILPAPTRPPESVLAPAPGLQVGVDPALRSAAPGGGAAVPLPGHVAALLAAFDGRRDVREAARAAWGEPAGADPRDLVDQAIERAGELERAGLLVDVPADASADRSRAELG